MTKEEIKALVAAKIAGQGSAVDAGGALAPILNAIVDIIPAGYELPIATDETLGGIKVGSNLSITEEGVLNAQGDAGPLIVEGHAGEFEFNFEPDEGQPTFAEAKAAFLAGRVVILKYPDSSNDNETMSAVWGIDITPTTEQLYVNGNLTYWGIARQ